jgi:RNA polymerase-interacting CarD/CdnL/TRCF family regulator
MELKRALEGLQETNHKLAMTNRQLNEDKESIASGYSTEISTIMEEIASKQKEIA